MRWCRTKRTWPAIQPKKTGYELLDYRFNLARRRAKP